MTGQRRLLSQGRCTLARCMHASRQHTQRRPRGTHPFELLSSVMWLAMRLVSRTSPLLTSRPSVLFSNASGEGSAACHSLDKMTCTSTSPGSISSLYELVLRLGETTVRDPFPND